MAFYFRYANAESLQSDSPLSADVANVAAQLYSEAVKNKDARFARERGFGYGAGSRHRESVSPVGGQDRFAAANGGAVRSNLSP